MSFAKKKKKKIIVASFACMSASLQESWDLVMQKSEQRNQSLKQCLGCLDASLQENVRCLVWEQTMASLVGWTQTETSVFDHNEPPFVLGFFLWQTLIEKSGLQVCDL